MSSRAGSILLRHAGSRLFTAAAVSPAVASRPLLAGGNGVPAVMVRLMSTSSPAAASEAKDEAAKASKEGGDKKAVVINSYWGIEQNNKLVRDDGTEWKWTCFRVSAPAAFRIALIIVQFFCPWRFVPVVNRFAFIVCD